MARRVFLARVIILRARFWLVESIVVARSLTRPLSSASEKEGHDDDEIVSSAGARSEEASVLPSFPSEGFLIAISRSSLAHLVGNQWIARSLARRRKEGKKAALTPLPTNVSWVYERERHCYCLCQRRCRATPAAHPGFQECCSATATAAATAREEPRTVIPRKLSLMKAD